MKKILSIGFYVLLLILIQSKCQDKGSLEAIIYTDDIDNFWIAYDSTKPNFQPEIFDDIYLGNASKGLKGFINNRIQSGSYLVSIINSHSDYFEKLKQSTDRISFMKDTISLHFKKLREIYPSSKFPPVYFVIGAMNSGGTTSSRGIIIGADLYGLNSQTVFEELNQWEKSVIKPVEKIPTIVIHELIHIQQKYGGNNLTLLEAAIREGSADFIAELVTGYILNDHVYDYANPKERELWFEFKDKMLEKNFDGWLYSSQKDRPNDLGYWMGYKITKSYYDRQQDKLKAIAEILTIRDFEKFLENSGYGSVF